MAGSLFAVRHAPRGVSALSEFQLAVLMFCLGGLVTLVTVAMILRGHRHWRHRDPFDRSA
jgi:hypothetical protein